MFCTALRHKFFKNVQVKDTNSVSVGLDYPGVGPELSSWKYSGRAKFIAVTDAQVFIGLRLLSQLEASSRLWKLYMQFTVLFKWPRLCERVKT